MPDMTTLRDVAERAEVSAITVSRVINEAGYVKAETRERVLHAIRELNYVPNLQARSLRSRRTHSLALLITDVTNPFWTTVARGVEDTAVENGFSVILCNTDEDPEKERSYIDVLIQKRVDGAIVAPASRDGTNLGRLLHQQIPFVIVDRRVDQIEADVVLSDSFEAARKLTRYLVERGHRRIAVITGPAGISTADERLAGYRNGLEEAEIGEDQALVYRGRFEQKTGHTATLELLALPDRPTAIFACNNFIAFGALIALRERGIAAPAELELASFDEIPLLSVIGPSLPMAVQPAYEMGAVATELLLERLAGTRQERREVHLETRLILEGQRLPELRSMMR